MVLDLGSKTVYEVKYEGRVFSLREPTAKDINDYQKAGEGEAGQSVENLLDFLNSLGLPKEVGEELGMSKLQMLTEHLTKEFSEKK